MADLLDEPLEKKISRKQAIEQLWNMGIVRFKLDKTQMQLYQSYIDSPTKTVVWAASRRLGKSYALCVIAIEQCLKHPNSIVKYVAPQQKMVKMIIRPLMREILRDCPKDLRPKFFTQDNVWRFPNGSEVQLAGTDNGNHESLRGGNSMLCIVDEAGFCDELEYLVQSILLPTMTTTNGKIILASTPPVNPDHPFVDYMRQAEMVGSYVKKTIYDNPRLSKEQIESFIAELGGPLSVTVRREYYCEVITDATRAVVPEWSPELELDIVKEWKRPPFFDSYTAMDIGFKDLTVVLFAYFDFRASKVIIEDEFVINGQEMTTDALARGIKYKEITLWKDPFSADPKKVYLRVADNNLIVLNDLQRLHDLTFLPTAKDDSDAALNHMRMMLAARRIIIHPRCKTLVSHLKHATWNKSRKSFDHSSDKGHFDGVDTLKYLIRNMSLSKNPYPAGYDLPKGEYFESPYHDLTPLNPVSALFKDMYTPKSSIKIGQGKKRFSPNK